MHVQYTTRNGRERSYYASFEGAMPYVERKHAEGGERLTATVRRVHARGAVPGLSRGPANPVALAVTVDGRSIADFCALPIGDLAAAAGA